MAGLKLRKLQTDDMFLLSAIVDKMELELDIEALAPKEGETATQVGFRAIGPLIMQAIRKLHLAKDEVKQLIANLSGLSVEEVGELPPGALVQAVQAIMSQEGVLDFLPSGGKLRSRKSTT